MLASPQVDALGVLFHALVHGQLNVLGVHLEGLTRRACIHLSRHAAVAQAQLASIIPVGFLFALHFCTGYFFRFLDNVARLSPNECE